MFHLTENHFLSNNYCLYEDDDGNRAKVIRAEGKFIVRIKFIDERVKAHGLAVPTPVPADFKGVHFKIDTSGGKRHDDPDVVSVCRATGDLISHWIDMISDIDLMDMNPAYFRKEDGSSPTAEEVARHKFSRLAEYEELSELCSSIA